MSEAIRSWLGRSVERPDGSVASIPTLYAVLDANAHLALADDACKVVAPPAPLMVVCDRHTEKYVEPVERALRDKGYATHVYVAPDEADGSPPAPTDEGAYAVQKELRAKAIALAVSVGSGTINDRTKYAAHLHQIPYLTYGTAASMNGYNSPIVAIYVKGLKSTVQATPPVGLYADPEVIAEAPRLMHLAGLGDLCSKPFAGADAVIASILSGKQGWRLPSEMVEEAFEQSLQGAAAIGQDDPQAIAQLMEALWISGFSMTLAGSSAPASGGEHLWSHRIDMAQHDAHQPLRALHGTQVGIACALVKPLFGRVAQLELDAIEARLAAFETEPPDPDDGETFAAWLSGRHPDLSPASRAAMAPEAAKKYDRSYRSSLRQQLLAHWPKVQAEVQQAFHHAQRISLALTAANAPQTPEEIGLSPQESNRILRICRDIRDRFTILDLHAELIAEPGL